MCIKIAKTAGFCFGVKNAVKMVEKLLEEKKNVCTLGHLIHSPQVVEKFNSCGVRVVENIEEVLKDEILVIRSHGVSKKVYDEIENLNVCYEDATCPFVKRIHNIVLKASMDGAFVLIAGDVFHPEVKGIIGSCFKNYFVFKNLIELKEFAFKNNWIKKEKVILVAQTTFNLKIWQEVVRFLERDCKNIKIFPTICLATTKRQKEADFESKKSDVSIVVGGKKSSNTKKLYDICKNNSISFFVESLKDFEKINYDFSGKKIFITAGASTPDFLIKKIFDRIFDKLHKKNTFN